jgi:hypothetical protein
MIRRCVVMMQPGKVARKDQRIRRRRCKGVGKLPGPVPLSREGHHERMRSIRRNPGRLSRDEKGQHGGTNHPSIAG